MINLILEDPLPLILGILTSGGILFLLSFHPLRRIKGTELYFAVKLFVEVSARYEKEISDLLLLVQKLERQRLPWIALLIWFHKLKLGRSIWVMRNARQWSFRELYLAF